MKNSLSSSKPQVHDQNNYCLVQEPQVHDDEVTGTIKVKGHDRHHPCPTRGKTSTSRVLPPRPLNKSFHTPAHDPSY